MCSRSIDQRTCKICLLSISASAYRYVLTYINGLHTDSDRDSSGTHLLLLTPCNYHMLFPFQGHTCGPHPPPPTMDTAASQGRTTHPVSGKQLSFSCSHPTPSTPHAMDRFPPPPSVWSARLPTCVSAQGSGQLSPHSTPSSAIPCHQEDRLPSAGMRAMAAAGPTITLQAVRTEGGARRPPLLCGVCPPGPQTLDP